MKFKPRAPREGINVSSTHPLREAALLVGGISAIFAALILVIGWSVDLAVRWIPPELEVHTFGGWAYDLGNPEHEPERLAVEGLTRRLSAHWPDAPYAFQVIVTDHSEANAAALPGGTILVTRGLLLELQSENELAFVLGHELGHFHSRDHLRGLGRVILYQLTASALFGFHVTAPDVTAFLGSMTARGFDRSQERAADRFGLNLVQAEYGHVAGSGRFFERLASHASELDELAAYVSTHPASSDRLEDLDDYAAEQGWERDGELDPWKRSN
jgi:Zn-dependent protease with chaperone function